MEQIKQKDLQKYKIGYDGIQVTHTYKKPHPYYISDISDIGEISLHDGNGGEDHFDISHIIPILRPLTDLYKPMENGEIPIVELANIAFPGPLNYELIETDGLADEYYVEIVGYTDIDIAFYVEHCSQSFDFMCSNSDNFFDYFYIGNQLQLFDWLYEHHFWLGDQSYFDKGLIIDKNTMEYFTKALGE